MLYIVSKNLVKPGKNQAFREAARELIELTRKEEGNLSYDLCDDVEHPNVLTFVERWQDREAIDRHMHSEHFCRIVPQLKPYQISSELNIYQVPERE